MTLPDWMTSIHPLDAGGIFFILLFIFIGWKRGLASELVGTLAIGGAIAAVALASDPLADWLAAHMAWSQQEAYIAAFFGAGLAALLIIAIFYGTLRSVVTVTFAKRIDRVGGALVGGLRALALLVLAVYLAEMADGSMLGRWCNRDSYIGRWVSDRSEQATTVVEREIVTTRAAIGQRRARTEQRHEKETGVDKSRPR